MPLSSLRPKPTIAKAATRPKPKRLAVALCSLANPNYPPTDVFTSDAQVKAEVIRLATLDSTPRVDTDAVPPNCHTHFIVLPGNPGVINYYRPFISRLRERLPAELRPVCHVHALGLPGHDLSELNGARVFGIADHESHCLSYLRSPHVNPPLHHANAVFVGHSYGSHLALRILERLTAEEARNASLVMLMPAVWEMARCAGMWTRWVLRDRLGVVSSALSLVTMLAPAVVRDAAVRATAHGASVADVGRRLMDGRRGSVFANVGALGRDEMAEIRAPVRRARGVARVRGRAALLWAEGDKWCPEEARRAVVEAFGGEIEVMRAGEGVTHAFVMADDEVERVVDMVVRWVTKALAADRAGKRNGTD